MSSFLVKIFDVFRLKISFEMSKTSKNVKPSGILLTGSSDPHQVA